MLNALCIERLLQFLFDFINYNFIVSYVERLFQSDSAEL